MKNTKSIVPVFILLFTLIFFSASISTAGGIQDRMKARIPAITALKNKGIIGEDNKGFLAYVTSAKEDQKLINAENSDRKKVYQAIAKKTKGNAAVVGERRADQLAQKSAKGHWYQDKSGKWHQK